MLGKFRCHLSYANVMATIAVFLSLGGGAYAATQINGKNIKDRTIAAKKIRRHAITATELSTRTLESLKGPKGDTGPRGAPGPASGPAGGDLTGNYPKPSIAPGAVTGAKVADGSLSGADVVDNSLTGSQIEESSLGTVPQALSAAVASSATDSASLGGQPASAYQQKCKTGTIEGTARVYGDKANFPTAYSTSSTYVDTTFNCGGGTVEVKRIGTGDYRVRFNGLGAVLGFANVDSGSNGGSGANDFANVAGLGGGEFQVETRDGSAGAAEDAFFSLVVI